MPSTQGKAYKGSQKWLQILEGVSKAQPFILSLSKDGRLGDWQAVETYVILRQAQDERDPPSTLETPS